MKKTLLILFLAFICFPVVANAQVIQTGDAKAEVKVETNVSGGDAYTKIEVEANGEKKVLETTEQGVHSLEVKSNKEAIIEIPSVSLSATLTPTIQVKNNIKRNDINIVEIFKYWLTNFFKQIGFSFIKLDK